MADHLLPVLRAWDTGFSYRCHACSRCCYGKRIQVNPYELVRLARTLGTTTSEVIAHHTAGGTSLATRADGSCVFLGPGGCTVHADRPLVCRLYPLGLIVAEDGREGFVELTPHPESEGVYGEDGTVKGYVESQGALPYLEAAARYQAVVRRLLSGTGDASAGTEDEEIPEAAAFLDAHLAIEWAAQRGGTPAPVEVDAVVDRHLALLHAWAERLAPGAREEVQP